jgi:hypothetical protein
MQLEVMLPDEETNIPIRGISLKIDEEERLIQGALSLEILSSIQR